MASNPSQGVAAPSAASQPQQPMSNQNLNQIVTDYLLKRGYTKTELVFREESRNIGPDGRPVHNDDDTMSHKKFSKAFHLLREWIESNLEIYKFELNKLLWPFFVYAWIDLLEQNYRDDAISFLSEVKPFFEKYRFDELRSFSLVTSPLLLKENPTARIYKDNKYRIPMNQAVVGPLFHFLEREASNGGAVITYVLQTYCRIDAVARGPLEPFSFEAIYRRNLGVDLHNFVEEEGIAGHTSGVNNQDVPDNSASLQLGALPMEESLKEDVRAELEEEDRKNPPSDGKHSLSDEFESMIKREQSENAPNRIDLPLPPSRARDVVIEMQKVRENRDRFRIEGHTGGVGPAVSALMYTFHNTLGSYNCLDFSKDNKLVAAGTMDSYIRVWTVDGSPLTSRRPDERGLQVNNRKLIGHSGPVYSVSFSDGSSNWGGRPFGHEGKDSPAPPDTSTRLLLSSSADGHVRLWSLDTWSCLCIYKGHMGPITRVLWAPHGHYFLTGGWDKTVRVWMQDHASAQRLLIGHDTSISAVAWHPNGTYVFSASDDVDKSIRMWSILTGECVRVFTGHIDHISSLECAPNGKILASGDTGGNIFFWDLAQGTRLKRSRGHGKGGIYSLNFGVESTVLASAGQDGTVRIWDVSSTSQSHHKSHPSISGGSGDGMAYSKDVVNNDVTGNGTLMAGGAGSSSSGLGAGAISGVSGRRKGKEATVTADQLSVFSTKHTPVTKVQFTRMNLVMAGGFYTPDR